MLYHYNIYYNQNLIGKVVSTDEQSAIKTVWMRSGHSSSRYSCMNMSDLRAERAINGH